MKITLLWLSGLKLLLMNILKIHEDILPLGKESFQPTVRQEEHLGKINEENKNMENSHSKNKEVKLWNPIKIYFIGKRNLQIKINSSK